MTENRRTGKRAPEGTVISVFRTSLSALETSYVYIMNTTLITEKASRARAASRQLLAASTAAKNDALFTMAKLLEQHRADIQRCNGEDMATAREQDVAPEKVKRLAFNETKIQARIESLREIAALPDPVGQTITVSRRPNGLQAARVRVPLGVILMIYEARPHVTVNAGALCIKAGNACLLRGGSEARRCNTYLGELWHTALEQAGLPVDAIQVLTCSHEETRELLTQRETIDLVIPRGGRALIETICEHATIPVIKHDAGICQVYIDKDADIAMATAITIDSKCLMPEVCNAAETLLVHEAHLEVLEKLVQDLSAAGIELRGCKRACRRVPALAPATQADWTTEYLDMTMSLRIVSTLEEAIEHINQCGSHHTDAIVTDSLQAAGRFTQLVDSGVVLVNGSTMFCDGRTLGMGAEIGISTDKLHARGPMGLEELTTYKHVLTGTGQIMGDGR